MVRSAVTARISRFAVSSSFCLRALSIDSCLLDAIATLHPSIASTFATPYPIPLLDAGTSAVLPLRPSSTILLPTLVDSVVGLYQQDSRRFLRTMQAKSR